MFTCCVCFISCTSLTSPINYYKNEQVIETSSNADRGSNKSIKQLHTRIGESPILTLERVERQQAGVYQCTADNNVGDPVTVDMRLDVLCKYYFSSFFFKYLHKNLIVS